MRQIKPEAISSKNSRANQKRMFIVFTLEFLGDHKSFSPSSLTHRNSPVAQSLYLLKNPMMVNISFFYARLNVFKKPGGAKARAPSHAVYEYDGVH